MIKCEKCGSTAISALQGSDSHWRQREDGTWRLEYFSINESDDVQAFCRNCDEEIEIPVVLPISVEQYNREYSPDVVVTLPEINYKEDPCD